MRDCPQCRPDFCCPRCTEHLMGEIDRTIVSLEAECGDPTTSDADRTEAREASDYLTGVREEHHAER